jgi:hypothetical protein
MTLRNRLRRREWTADNRGFQTAVESPARELPDGEEAGVTGENLWLTPDWERRSRCLARNPLMADKAVAYRNWDLASKASRTAGHSVYHAGLRPQAMAVWLTKKPEILEHRRTHGR